MSFFHPKFAAPIGCAFHQSAEAEYYWTPPFVRLRFVLWWNLIIQLKLESAFPIGYQSLHIRCHYWTAYAETKGGLCGAQIRQHRLLAENLETAHAIGPETMTCLLLLTVNMDKESCETIAIQQKGFEKMPLCQNKHIINVVVIKFA